MKSILLIGLGRFGKHLAECFNEHHHEIMAIDRNEDRVNEALRFVTRAQIGDATNEAFLRSLGVENYDLCFVTISGDFQSSLETTSLLKEFGAKHVVARAERDIQAKFLLRNGADEVIYPEEQVSKWAAIRYSSEHILDYMALDDTNGVYDMEIPGKWIGKTVRQLDIRQKYNITILGLKKNGVTNWHIGADDELTADYSLLVLGDYKNIEKCFHL